MNSGRYRLVVLIALAIAAIGVSGCSLDKQEMPPLSGPSELALSLTLTASPDQLSRGTGTQSIVTITARDASGNPIAGQRISLTLGPNAPQGAVLSQSEVTTGSNGTATFAVTAPNANSLGNITVLATPVGTNASSAVPRIITITALPENSAAPEFAPTPFTVTCNGVTPCITTPEIGEVVTFDGSCHPTDCSVSGVKDEGQPCNACSFTWNFGGDGTASGQIVSHAFSTAGTFVVTETVRDAGGLAAVAQQSVTVTALGIPTASFSVSPATPIVGQPATFRATATASSGHRIVSYTWSWGDGSGDTSSSSPSVAHTFSNAGRFFVTLTVRDDVGQTMQAFQNLTVSSGLVASYTATQVGPASDHKVHFDASASQSNTGTKIVDYNWDFGDGNNTNGSSPTVDHSYGAAGTYTVTLTITDDRGAKATTSQATAGGGGGGIVVN